MRALPLLAVIVLAGCTSTPEPPAHGPLIVVKEDERLDLGAHKTASFALPPFSTKMYVEYAFDERDNGDLDACILPASELDLWNAEKEAHGHGCVKKKEDASSWAVVSPGQHHLAFRCRNTFEKCILTFDLRYATLTEEVRN